MEQGDPPEAPGRLRAKAGLDGLEVRLPGLHARSLLLYALLVPLLWCNGMLTAALLGQPLGLLALAFLLGMGALGALRPERARGGLAALVLAAAAGIFWLTSALEVPSFPFGRFADASMLIGGAASLASVGLGFLLATRAGQARAAAVGDARLEIRAGRRRTSWALEEIREIEGSTGWAGEVRINGEPVPALGALTGAERAWVVDRIATAVRGRRAALERQGHDLARAAPPPAALADLIKR